MRTARGSFKIALSLFLVVQMLFGYFSAVNFTSAQGVNGPLDSSNSVVNNRPIYSGVENSLQAYLCVPSKDSVGTALYSCIGKMYRFGIAFGAIALVFFIVFAGYLYITGGETGKEKGKSVFLSALTGMAIMLSSYVLLSFINPELTKIKVIQPPIFTAADLPKCVDVGLGENCVLPNGQVNTGGTGVPGSASEAQYKDLIKKYADQNGLRYCALSALIQKESSFRRLVMSNPEAMINEQAGPPTYGVSFSKFHAIGLTQITIYPKTKGGWVGDTPARSSAENFGKSPLTLQMLLDPETNISAGAKYFGKLYAKNKQNLRATYDDFQSGEGDTKPGREDSDPATLTKYMNMYDACERRG